MKKLLLLFTLSIYQIGFSQVDINIDKKLTIEELLGEDEDYSENYTPFDYISNGVYKTFLRGDTNIPYLIKYRKGLLERFVKKNNYSYEIISEREEYDGRKTTWELIFKLKDSTGTTIITKKEAKKQLLDLKELLDLGLITQTEFDNKAEGLKKVLLN